MKRFIVELFTPRGRVGRLRFLKIGVSLLASMLMALLISLLMRYHQFPLAYLIDAILAIGLWPLVVLIIFNVIKRLHDLNYPGIGWLLIFFIPLNIFIFLFLLLKKGTNGSNKYGEDPLAE